MDVPTHRDADADGRATPCPVTSDSSRGSCTPEAHGFRGARGNPASRVLHATREEGQCSSGCDHSTHGTL
jgi:hypothetical protein